MSGARRSALAAVVVLLVLGLLWPRERAVHGADSFGTVPAGQRALFELLTELGFDVARSYARATTFEPDSVVWWIEPEALCAPAPAPADEAESAEPRPVAWDPDAWLRSGGTALVFLPAGLSSEGCRSLGPYALPALVMGVGDETATAPEDGDDGEELPEATELLEGEVLARPRALPGLRLERFAGTGGLTPLAWFQGNEEEPFALERGVGDGRLIVLADGRFLRNEHLDHGDVAPLALDLVRAFGVPRLDERAHGLRAEQRPHVYLAGSSALPVFAGLLLLGGLAVWRGHALPRRNVAEADPDAPELERFVSSLATLYARSRDHAALASRYREASLARLRRGLGLAPDTPAAAVLARLRAQGRLGEAEAAALAREPDPPVASAAALRAFARRLDALVEEACP